MFELSEPIETLRRLINETGMKKSILKWSIRALVGLAVLVQFVRPARTNPPIDEKLTIQKNSHMSTEASDILLRSCYDCHSSATVWPWYSNIAPVSWYLVRHVNAGRKELSFSDWGSYTAKRRARKLKEICEQLEKNEMPLSTYLPLHPDAGLSDADKALLYQWAREERAQIEMTAADTLH